MVMDCLFFEGINLFVEFGKDGLILRIPCRLRGISVCRARGAHGWNAEPLEDGVVVGVIRRLCSDKLIGDGYASFVDLFRGELL